MQSLKIILVSFLLCFLATAHSQESVQISNSSQFDKGLLDVTNGFNPEWGLGLETDFYLEYSNLPSSRQGRTVFEFSELKLSPRVKLNDKLATFFRLSLVDERSTRANNYVSHLENAYIQYRPNLQSSWTHEVGLIRPYWHRHEGIVDSVDIFGTPSKSLARRYRFLGLGDLGYQGRYGFSENRFVTFGLVNGEENNEGENGPSKEGFVAYVSQGRKQLFGLWLSHGRVDVVEKKVADRNRAHLRYQVLLGRVSLGAEGLWAQDSSTDIENEQRAEGMTFTELTEVRNITTLAGRLEAHYQLNDRQKVLVRYDLLRPEFKNKDVESWMAAWVQQEQSYLSWGLFYENTLFGAEHSAQSQQRERVRLGLNLNF